VSQSQTLLIRRHFRVRVALRRRRRRSARRSSRSRRARAATSAAAAAAVLRSAGSHRRAHRVARSLARVAPWRTKGDNQSATGTGTQGSRDSSSSWEPADAGGDPGPEPAPEPAPAPDLAPAPASAAPAPPLAAPAAPAPAEAAEGARVANSGGSTPPESLASVDLSRSISDRVCGEHEIRTRKRSRRWQQSENWPSSDRRHHLHKLHLHRRPPRLQLLARLHSRQQAQRRAVRLRQAGQRRAASRSHSPGQRCRTSPCGS
jgi:hypothetical protein